jgi:hypothetical protein
MEHIIYCIVRVGHVLGTSKLAEFHFMKLTLHFGAGCVFSPEDSPYINLVRCLAAKRPSFVAFVGTLAVALRDGIRSINLLS